jgi:hypothetical protein
MNRGNFRLDGRTIGIIALVVIAAVIFLPRLLGGGETDERVDTRDDFNQDSPLAPNQPNQPNQPNRPTNDGVVLGNLVSATGIDRNGCPTQVTANFDESDQPIYVVAEGSDIPEGTTVFVRLYRDGQPVEDADQIRADQDYDNTCIYFAFEPDGGARSLQPGDYEAEFVVNGNPADSVQFEIN